jgi:hypothetical protein
MVNLSKVRWWGEAISITLSFGGTAARPDDTVDSIVARSQSAVEESLANSGNRVTILSL